MAQNKSPIKGIIIYVIAMIVIFGAIYYMSSDRKVDTDYSYSEFVEDISNDAVKDIIITQNQEVPTGVLAITFRNGAQKALYVENIGTITPLLQEKGISYYMKDVTRQSYFLSNILPIIIVLIIMIIIFSFMSNRGGAGGGNVMNFGKSRAKMTDQNQNKTTFRDVAGLKEEREDLEEIVEFLKDPQKYTRVGARIPKGVILVGPPGTGKTLLARATSGEAGVPFFSISGSDFVEMFVGVGASRVRDLFSEAKKNAPCIIFIDEIDAVARRRGSGLGGGHDEREQTLNQILVEMDGFGVNQGIIVMAATNRVDILDPAILRPGRFDRKVFVGLPDAGAREEILKVHARNKPLAEDVNLSTVARTTVGFSGADLENLLNEAAIIAADHNRAYIKQEDINKAFIKVGVGAEKKSKKVAKKDREITAYHEAGHALLFHLLPDVGPVHMVSIIPTGGAGGYTMPLPEKEDMFNSKQKMLQNIIVSFGGRIAEDITFGDITTGASQDIKQASGIARAMVTKYGMSEKLGPIDYAGNDSDEVFIGRDWGHAKSYAETTAAEIDKEVKEIIDSCYAKAKEMLLENQDILKACAELLLEKERINRAEFEALFVKPEPVVVEPTPVAPTPVEPAVPVVEEPVAEAPVVEAPVEEPAAEPVAETPAEEPAETTESTEE